jgi:hypothetical protein
MIYVIRSNGSEFVKIGFTKSKETLAKRLKSLSACSPFKLKVEALMNGSKLKERCLHSFCISRHHNGEWFRLSKEEVQRFVEKYRYWAPTKNGVERMSTIHFKLKDKYFK